MEFTLSSQLRPGNCSGKRKRCGKGVFSQSQLSVQTLLRCPHIPCAIARFNIRAHVKDPVVHVRVRWIMETPKHPACSVSLEAWLRRGWHSAGKATWISHGRNPNGTIQLYKIMIIIIIIIVITTLIVQTLRQSEKYTSWFNGSVNETFTPHLPDNHGVQLF